jgi:hypothetical protein
MEAETEFFAPVQASGTGRIELLAGACAGAADGISTECSCSNGGKVKARQNDEGRSTDFEKLTLVLATQSSVLLISGYVRATLLHPAVQ